MFDAVYLCDSLAPIAHTASLESLSPAATVQVNRLLEDYCPVEGPRELTQRDEIIDQIREFVYELPQGLREIARRKYWLGQSQTEIAEDLGVTRSNVCHALARVNKLGRVFFDVAEH